MNMLLKIMICLLIILIPIFEVFNKTIDAETKVTINVPVLNVRKGPGLSYNVISQVKKDETYSVVKKENDWVQLKLSNGTTGWVASWYTKTFEVKEGNNSSFSNPEAISTVNDLRVRKGPGTSFQVIGYLDKGDKAAFLDQNNNWVKILYNKQEGWVYSEYVNINKNTLEQPNHTAQTGTVTASVLNVREKGTTNSKIVGKLANGTKVTILTIQGNWAEIKAGNTKGWVAKEYLIIKTDEPNKNNPQHEENKLEKGQITATILNVRNESSLNGKIISQVKKGDTVQILKEENEWYYVILPNNSKGWIAGWYVTKITDKVGEKPKQEDKPQGEYISILYNGTNIRSGPSTSNTIKLIAKQGDTFPIIAIEGDWYKIKLPNNQIGYVAGWIVKSSNQSTIIEHQGIEKYFNGKTIVIDPGHGGQDGGAVGVNGTLEKDVNLKTAKLVYDKLKATGANVILTRNTDYYLSLRNRVTTSHYHNADVFVSIHYNSSIHPYVKGASTYYYHSPNKKLAQVIQDQIVRNTGFIDRGIHFGDFQVIRENKQPAVLIEFGFLSNHAEEIIIRTNSYQEKAANAVYYGLAQYFK